MPFILTNPDSVLSISSAIGSTEFKYDYPNGLDLRPGSDKHQYILSRVLRYAYESAKMIAKRHPAWEEIDEKLTAYVHLSDEEREVKKKDINKPVRIVFPYTYAMQETLISYMVSAFLPEPMFRYEGVGPEDILGAKLLEKVIGLHIARNKVGLNLHTMFRDASGYGVGMVAPQWDVKMGRRVRNLNGARITTDDVLFEGNALTNIDPYRYLPDPNMPIHDVQRGEFVGWLDRRSYMDLLSQEQHDDTMFNVKYLQFANNKGTSVFGANQYVQRRATLRDRRNQPPDRQVSDPIDQLHMYVKLIPSQWGLGKGEYPERWLFTVAGDAVVLRAQPTDLNHNMFPVAICAPDFDGYSPVAYSRLEQLQGMQVIVDWMFNAHVANVRKAINDVLIVDPYLINVKDLENPGAGGFVRLRRPAWGRQLMDHAVKQLNIVDITANNMRDVELIMRYMQQVGGMDNSTMGSLRLGGPERLTSAEFQGTARGQVSRLERIARVIGLQAMIDVGYMFASHTQQFMSRDAFVRTTGDWPEELLNILDVQQERVRVTPDQLLIEYDVLPRDGSIPGGNYSSAMPELFKTIANSQELLQEFDVVRIFQWIAENEGVKNVQDFRRRKPPQMAIATAPDEQVMREVERGNMVPLMGGQ